MWTLDNSTSLPFLGPPNLRIVDIVHFLDPASSVLTLLLLTSWFPYMRAFLPGGRLDRGDCLSTQPLSWPRYNEKGRYMTELLLVGRFDFSIDDKVIGIVKSQLALCRPNCPFLSDSVRCSNPSNKLYFFPLGRQILLPTIKNLDSPGLQKVIYNCV